MVNAASARTASEPAGVARQRGAARNNAGGRRPHAARGASKREGPGAPARGMLLRAPWPGRGRGLNFRLWTWTHTSPWWGHSRRCSLEVKLALVQSPNNLRQFLTVFKLRPSRPRKQAVLAC